MQLTYLLLFIISSFFSHDGDAVSDDEARIFDLKKVNGAGCPYTASWLAHVNLYRRVVWYLDSTKMEAASFSIFDTSRLKFQVADPDAYYVNHMSMYEHLVHKKEGHGIAQNKTLILSQTAMKGECDNLNISKSKEYLALIPFYGGLPPGVTADMKVKSIGQGNSLVSASTKVIIYRFIFMRFWLFRIFHVFGPYFFVIHMLKFYLRKRHYYHHHHHCHHYHYYH
jgi:hypothetical protein